MAAVPAAALRSPNGTAATLDLCAAAVGVSEMHSIQILECARMFRQNRHHSARDFALRFDLDLDAMLERTDWWMDNARLQGAAASSVLPAPTGMLSAAAPPIAAASASSASAPAIVAANTVRTILYFRVTYN